MFEKIESREGLAIEFNCSRPRLRQVMMDIVDEHLMGFEGSDQEIEEYSNQLYKWYEEIVWDFKLK